MERSDKGKKPMVTEAPQAGIVAGRNAVLELLKILKHLKLSLMIRKNLFVLPKKEWG